jgi:hypothetical protein
MVFFPNGHFEALIKLSLKHFITDINMFPWPDFQFLLRFGGPKEKLNLKASLPESNNQGRLCALGDCIAENHQQSLAPG